ncbi:TlpA family protein disulfide reductase [Geothrix fuzhouensis]|uniref:TlpA family protein disulfide reductase n=1 Tax=Geothrix fuzhouensis TaxID=2966451 RepID=UPI00214950F7|nr:TlpA disulfide reductase family protein [Geothrix fuzhouensis]
MTSTRLLLAAGLSTLGLLGQAPAASKPEGASAATAQAPQGLRSAEALEARIGQPVADVQFADLEGKAWSLSALRGKVVYLNVWFTGCPPCVKEIPDLNALHARFGSHPDLVMLALTYDDESKVREFLKTRPFQFPVACIPFAALKQLAMSGSSVVFPTHLILDRQGNLAVASTGGSEQISRNLAFSLGQVLGAPASPSAGR